MKTVTYRKRHESLIHGSQAKYIMLAVLATVVIIAVVVMISFLFKVITID